jgi:RNA polymerase sigma-70 factor (sigma-E family)
MRIRTNPEAYERNLAFRSFARQHAAPLHRSAYLLCGDWHLAEDLVQEALAKVFVHWRRVQDADNPDAYVRRILVNEARRRWRRKDAPVPRAEAVTDRAGPDWSEEVLRRAELFEALMRLPAGQRATIVLRHLDGLSERETAVALGCSEGTVKSQTSRAMAALRKYIESQEAKA